MQDALANRITHIPPRLAGWRPSLEKRPFLGAAALGACLGILGTCCSMLLLSLSLRLLPPELWGNSAASSLAGLGPGAIFFFAVLYGPLFETLVGQLVPIEIAHRLGAQPLVCVLLSGFLFGWGHYANGGLVHGISTFFGGLVFACAYVALRWIGVGPAFIAASTAHAVHNMMVLFVIGPLLPNPL